MNNHRYGLAPGLTCINLRSALARVWVKSLCKYAAAIFAVLFGLMWALPATLAHAQQAPAYSNDFLMDNTTITFVMVDRLEILGGSNHLLVLDAQGYTGNNRDKFWFKTEGEAATLVAEGEISAEGLYSRAITPFFDAQLGWRQDIAYAAQATDTRGFAVIGLQGLAPYLFELDGSLYVSTAGDVSAQLEAEYDLPVTQRLWLQPRLEAAAAVQEVPDWGVGNGLNSMQLGLRLRYEIRREFAPYLGFSWSRAVGETADFARAEGTNAGTLSALAGLRMWF